MPAISDPQLKPITHQDFPLLSLDLLGEHPGDGAVLAGDVIEDADQHVQESCYHGPRQPQSIPHTRAKGF